MKVHYSGITGEWRIEGKNKDRGNVKAISTYGTQRINAYEIIEDTLNLKDVRIFDYVYDADGKKIAVLNKKETAIAQSKQELIKDAFAEWIWKDPDRREAIAYAIENHCPGDVIILCGKGHEDYQIIGKTKVHMDEREIVAEILEKRKREK